MRGFQAANIGVMVNGVPVNDMEWGGVYWSNWAGLSDVTVLCKHNAVLSVEGVFAVGRWYYQYRDTYH